MYNVLNSLVTLHIIVCLLTKVKPSFSFDKEKMDSFSPMTSSYLSCCYFFLDIFLIWLMTQHNSALLTLLYCCSFHSFLFFFAENCLSLICRKQWCRLDIGGFLSWCFCSCPHYCFSGMEEKNSQEKKWMQLIYRSVWGLKLFDLHSSLHFLLDIFVTDYRYVWRWTLRENCTV